jgi:acid phosphatase
VTKLLVFVVENHSLDQMRTQMPKVFSLAQQYGYADDFYAVTHPSLPNYVVMTSGHLHGVTFDAPPSRWPLKGPSIFGRALDAGLTAKAYADAMPANCTLTDDGTYAVRHNPWTYFVDERDQCRRYDVPVAELDRDVAAGNLPNAGFVAPDLCHDAHNCGLDQADQWLGTELGTVLAGPDFRSGRLAVVVTADEDDHHEDNKILTVVMHPSQHGDVVHDRLDHYSLYGLYEDVLGLPHLPTDRPTGSMAKAFGLPVTGS